MYNCFQGLVVWPPWAAKSKWQQMLGAEWVFQTKKIDFQHSADFKLLIRI
jgi:hypothetical protein